MHKNDVDPWPSKPHGHIYDKNQVVDADGNIYDKTTKQKVGKLSKKGLKKWAKFLKKLGPLSLLFCVLTYDTDKTFGENVEEAFDDALGVSPAY